MPRKDMSDHIRENSLSHISLLAALTQKLAAKIVEKDEQIAKVMSNMQTRMEVTISKLKTELGDHFEREHAAILTENMALKAELEQLRKNHNESSIASLTRKVDDLKKNCNTMKLEPVQKLNREKKRLLHYNPILLWLPLNLSCQTLKYTDKELRVGRVYHSTPTHKDTRCISW